jgi:hypothetical protein
MYNIHSHYENILSYAKSIIAHPTLAYLHPFGATQPDNIETLNSGGFGPLLFCYDQEPLLPDFNDHTFQSSWRIVDDCGNAKQSILLNTERHSSIKNKLLDKFGFVDCHYFFHAFAAADWYRGYQYCSQLIPIQNRKIRKKYITFNRLTGGARVYRSFLLAELEKNSLVNHGHISYSHRCPEHGDYKTNILKSIANFNIKEKYALECLEILDSIDYPLLIDTEENITNGSQTLGAIPQLMESFLHVVTETCFWEEKTHLTEKIFKPIVAQQPFVLLACVNNLEYLRSYGFKTFDSFWDESYDNIVDPIQRLKAVVNIIKDLCALSNKELEDLLKAMTPILEHNYKWFYSKDFIDFCWDELTNNLKNAIAQLPPRIFLENQFPTSLDTRVQNIHREYQIDI